VLVPTNYECNGLMGFRVGGERDCGGRRSGALCGRAGAPHSPRFALTKSRPTTLPTTLLARSALFGQLTAGAGKRLTAVAGSAGAGFALGQDRPRVSLAEDQHLAGPPRSGL